MHGSLGKVTVVTIAALVLLVVFGVLATPASATPSAPATGTTTTSWAYGAVKNVSWGPTPLKDHPAWVWKGDVTIGFSVILNQTNTSASTVELHLDRSMGVRWSVEYCLASCSSPTQFLSISYAQSEVIDAYANLTDQGSVFVNGSAVPAVALLNSSAHVVANLTNTANSLLARSTGAIVDRSVEVYASVESQSAVWFTPYLGLFPLNLTGPEQWASSASFSATGATTASYFAHVASSAGPGGTLSGKATFPLSASGNVSVNGNYSPADEWSFSGVRYPAVGLTIEGPFSVREGLILIPSPADLFGGAPESWSGNETGDATVSMASLDVGLNSGGHVGIVASSWQFSSDSFGSLTELASVGTPAPAATTPDPVITPQTIVQASPVSVSTARADSGCLTNGTGCPGATNLTPNLRGLLFSVAVAAIVVAVVATLAIVLISERRRLPPPVYPNANLYPPGAAGLYAPSLPPQRPAPPPPPEEDPLDHLW